MLKKLVPETFTNAPWRDRNCAVWLVGCFWKFLVLHRIELHSIRC